MTVIVNGKEKNPVKMYKNKEIKIKKTLLKNRKGKERTPTFEKLNPKVASFFYF